MKNEIKSVNTRLKTRYMYMYNYGVKVVYMTYNVLYMIGHHLSMNFEFQTQQQNLMNRETDDQKVTVLTVLHCITLFLSSLELVRD